MLKETPFAQLALLGEEQERTTSRLELARLIADFLRGLYHRRDDEVAELERAFRGEL